MLKSLALAAALVLSAGNVLAQPKSDGAKDQPAKEVEQAKLAVGDKAPAIEVETWLKGSPVTGFEKGKVYVVEFWATWCGPCRASMPHLSEIQKNHKAQGLTVIGVNIWEDKEYNAETLKKAKDFVGKQGEKMDYTVAFDGGAKKMDKHYMGASGSNGIPTAFIVDQNGMIAYIGHPGQMEKTLDLVLANKHDLKQLADQAKDEGALEGKMMDLMKAGRSGKTDEWYTQAAALVDGPAKNNAEALNYIAWSIVDPKSTLKDKKLDLAMKAANRANEITAGKDPAILDTLARACFVKGDKAKAIELQTKAVDLSKGNEEMLEDLKKTLDEYKSAK